MLRAPFTLPTSDFFLSQFIFWSRSQWPIQFKWECSHYNQFSDSSKKKNDSVNFNIRFCHWKLIRKEKNRARKKSDSRSQWSVQSNGGVHTTHFLFQNSNTDFDNWMHVEIVYCLQSEEEKNVSAIVNKTPESENLSELENETFLESRCVVWTGA